MPASSSSTDPSASLLSRPKLKKAAPRKRRPKGEAPADYAGDAVSHRQGDPDAADADSLADQLFASLGEPRSRSPPSSSTLASPSSATISGSDDDRGSPREKGSSIASKLSTLGDEIKDALVPHGPKRNRHKERLAKRRHDTDMARRGAMQEVAAAGPDADKGRLEDRAIAEACQGLGVDLFEVCRLTPFCSALAHRYTWFALDQPRWTLLVLSYRRPAEHLPRAADTVHSRQSRPSFKSLWQPRRRTSERTSHLCKLP